MPAIDLASFLLGSGIGALIAVSAVILVQAVQTDEDDA